MLRKQAKTFKNQNLITDFFRNNAELGDIYQMDDGGWIILTNLFELMPEIKKSEYLLPRSSIKDITYTKATGTAVKFSGSGSSGSIGEIESEISFSHKKSAFVSLKKAFWQNVNLAKVKPIIDKLWKDLGYDKKPTRYFFVNQICVAESGTTIYSEEANNTVKIQSKLSQPLTSLSIIGEANVEIVTNKKETLEIICPVSHVPLFQAVRQRRNGLWEIL